MHSKTLQKKKGFERKRSTPLHPQANSIVERFMSPLQKAIKTAIAQGQNYMDELNPYLLNYRNTQHPSTGKSPAMIMFNRRQKTKLPKLTSKRNDTNVRDRDSLSKSKNKLYADKKRRAKHRNLKIGDKVLLRRETRNKFQTLFDPIPGTIIDKKGSMITIEHKGKRVTRDISKFKVVQNGENKQDKTPDQDLDKAPDQGSSYQRPQRNRRVPKRYRDEG